MKILRIISFGFEGGGAETSVVEVDRILRKKGNVIKVISSDVRPSVPHFSDFEFKAINPNNPFKVFFHLINVSAFFTIRKVVKNYKPDIVLLDTMGEISPLALLLFRNIPLVMTIHGPEFFIPNLLIWAMNKNNFKNEKIDKGNFNLTGKINYLYFKYIQGAAYKLTLKKVNLFIVNSTYMQKIIKNDLKPNVVIHNGIKLLKYKQIGNNNNLLYVGRIEKYKGVEYAIKAMPKIIEKFPQTQFSIVGEGTYEKNLVSLVKKMKLQDNIHFLGWVNHKDIESYYEKSSVVIMPSLVPEAFGNTGIEAMSKGRPVIASRVGGIPEWLEDEKSGFLINPGNSNEIAEKIIKLFGNHNLLIAFSKNAGNRAKSFSSETYAANLEKTYQSLISNL